MTASEVGGRDDVFGAGKVADDLAAVDWHRTPLGPPSTWPAPLSSMVRVLLSSRFSMWLAWGPELTFFCNDAYRRDTLGSKYPWALGRPAAEVWAEIWPDIGPRIERVMSTREATWDEALLLYLERSGYREETYHTFSYSPLSDDDGAVAGMLCVVSEDTARVVGGQRLALVRDLGSRLTAQKSEAEVVAAAARELQSAGSLLPFTATYLLDDEGTPVLRGSSGPAPGSDAATALFGPGPERLWPVQEVLEGRTVVVDGLAERVRHLSAGPWEQPPRRAVVVPFRAQDETRPLGFLVAGVTPYRPLDDEHRGFVELLAGQVAAALSSARAYEDERRRAERLQELDRAKTDFFTNVSHEFRTPLTLMLGPAEDALADEGEPLGGRQRHRIEVVHRNGERLLKLVDTLLDFSRLEAGDAQAQFEPVDLAALTAELAETFRPAVERVGLTLDVRCDDLGRPVWVDRDMWAKIVLNLLSNALKFTFDGGVTVHLVAEPDGARLLVRDTGTGIGPEQQQRLFTRFARVAGARSRSFEGSGIGLALVHDLAVLHGGGVDVASAPGEGSTFSVSVPWGREHLPEHGVVDSAGDDGGAGSARSSRGFLAEATRWLVDTVGPTAAAPAVTGDRPRVLVADDNADMREYVVHLLSPDHDVVVATDGREALELARSDPPDLVLSDVMMPRLDGLALMAALRADVATAHVPVVLVSARAGEEATVHGLEAGADDYLSKPFSARELRARVRANLELDRVRRTRRHLERMQALLDQAQRLAGVGSWEIDLSDGAVTASAEFLRQLDMSEEELAAAASADTLGERVHPDDREVVQAALQRAIDTGEPVDYVVRLVDRAGETRVFRTLGEVDRDDQGRPVRLRGSNQDITAQLAVEAAREAAAVATETAAREHRIADELQRSLLPEDDVHADELTVAASYSAGAEGTQVGGDWYDVIELGGGRSALVVGDVMGRGVRAAAVMGQLRSAVRAFARLDLPPSQVLEHLDGVVRDVGEEQIVTCLYAVYDPFDTTLSVANAGHLPPLLRHADGRVERLDLAQAPPLGALTTVADEKRVALAPGDVLVLYTDGLVEERSGDIDDGIQALAEQLATLSSPVTRETPGRLVATLLPDGSDDDVAVLMAQVHEAATGRTLLLTVDADPAAAPAARRAAVSWLTGLHLPEETRQTVALLLTELLTNALVHGHPPVHLRIRRGGAALALEVHDDARTLPQRRSPTNDDEHGRGLQLVAALASRWGTRPTAEGKAVWCTVALP